MNIIVNGQNEGYYWRVRMYDGKEYGPLYNTAKTADEAREQAQTFVRESLGYKQPTDEEMKIHLALRCEKIVEQRYDEEFPCPSCGQDEGWDGYCDDVDCPNYKGGLIVDYCERHGLEY